MLRRPASYTLAVVGGDPLELEQGYYRVVVQTSPPKTFPEVEVPGEKEVQLEVN